MKNILIISGIVILLLVGGVWWSNRLKEKAITDIPEGELISRGGVHWHPQIEIYVKGEKQEIPANIGIGPQYAGSPWFDPMMTMTNVHTHDDSGTLHWEVMKGPVTKDEARLGVFFEIWGKEFSSEQIFEYANDTDGTVRMTVNGNENMEFNDYTVQDGDKIELRYE